MALQRLRSKANGTLQKKMLNFENRCASFARVRATTQSLLRCCNCGRVRTRQCNRGTAGGVCTGLGGVRTAREIRAKSKVGGGRKEFAKATITEGLAQLHPSLIFLRDVGSIAKTIGSSDARRLTAKLRRGQQFLRQVDVDIAKAQSLQRMCDEHGLPDSVKQRVIKAERRLLQGKAAVNEWVNSKLESGKLPLLAQNLMQALAPDE